MRRALAFLLPATVLACGDSSAVPVDGGAPDGSTLDDGTAADVPSLPDASDAPYDSGVKNPAVWSKAFEKVEFVDILERTVSSAPAGTRVLANIINGDIGGGPYLDTMAFGAFDSSGSYVAKEEFTAAGETGLQASSPFGVLSRTKDGLNYRARWIDPSKQTFGAKDFATSPAKRVTMLRSTGATSFHLAGDSLASGSDSNFSDNVAAELLTMLDMCVYPPLDFVSKTSGCTSNTSAGYAAIDDGATGGFQGGATATVSGRQLGPSFNYNLVKYPAAATSGAGYFVASYSSSYPSNVRVSLVGGQPLAPADSGQWTRAVSHFRDPIFVAPFKGTMDFGKGPLVAPASGHAIALARGYLSGASANWTESFVLPKGPASEGRASAPWAELTSADEVVLVDLVWDWIEIGGVRIDALHPKGDILVARISLLSGKPLGYALYGGPGEVTRLGATSCEDPRDICLGGQTEAGLELGQGPLPAGMFLARIKQP